MIHRNHALPSRRRLARPRLQPVLRWLAAGCFGAVLAGCDSPGAEIDRVPELLDQTRHDAEVETTEPVLIGSAHVPNSLSSTVALLDERTACTFDTYQTKIDCVDRSGRVIGHFGSAGEGPGEFRDPTQLVRGTDGSLGVMDNISSKFLVFTRVGELITEFSLPNRRVFYPASPFDTTIIGVSWGTGPVADGIDDILVGGRWHKGGCIRGLPRPVVECKRDQEPAAQENVRQHPHPRSISSMIGTALVAISIMPAT